MTHYKVISTQGRSTKVLYTGEAFDRKDGERDFAEFRKAQRVLNDLLLVLSVQGWRKDGQDLYRKGDKVARIEVIRENI